MEQYKSTERKCDMEQAVKDVLSGMSKSNLLEKHGSGVVMNKRKIDEYAHDIKEESAKKARYESHVNMEFRQWQKVMELKEKQNDILWRAY
ncbi:hypothetical protein DPMN_065626 [Dreissena polymorpha]|uniref:Uncharacterized protein n=1 Tax=Dreissena polymorpha TaxID=45954 RepID=A0A9D3YVR3_DREPO|nr:hypothetical protein DPMN_065626 [Dreissena polymorpha]